MNDKELNNKSLVSVKKSVKIDKFDKDFKNIMDTKNIYINKLDYMSKVDKINNKSPVPRPDVEKLNFDGILSMEQDFKKKFKD